MSASMGKLGVFFRMSEDGRYIHLALDEKALPILTDKLPKILLRVLLLCGETVEFRCPPDKKWQRLSDGPSKVLDKDGLRSFVIGWGNFLLAFVERVRESMQRCQINPFILPDEGEPQSTAEDTKDGVVFGLSPKDTGLAHLSLHGPSEPEKIASCNRIALGDDPRAVGTANAIAYIKHPRIVALCNFVSFSGTPEKVGEANGIFKDVRIITIMNTDSFTSEDGLINEDGFVTAMYSSFAKKPSSLVGEIMYFYYNDPCNLHYKYEEEVRSIGAALQKLFEDDYQSFVSAIRSVIKEPTVSLVPTCHSTLIERFLVHITGQKWPDDVVRDICGTEEDDRIAYFREHYEYCKKESQPQS